MQVNPLGINADDIVLLWSDLTPMGTGQSGQDITLSEPIEHFRFYCVMYAPDTFITTNIRMTTGLIPTTSPTVLQGFLFNESDIPNNQAGLLVFRPCGPVSGTTFHIDNAYYTQVNVNPSPYAGACIVRKIYGIR